MGKTDEQAPLPSALAQLLERVKGCLNNAGDLIFNCQMGYGSIAICRLSILMLLVSRGRTTTGMVAASLISTILTQESTWDPSYLEEKDLTLSDPLEGPSPEEVYTQGKLSQICSNERIFI